MVLDTMIRDQLLQLHRLFGIADRKLVSVAEIQSDGMTICVTLSFSCFDLVLTADSEFDTIRMSINDNHSRPTVSDGFRTPVWMKCIGDQLSWAWLTVNYLGYPDGVVLSFGDGMIPHVLCIVAASSFRITAAGSHGESARKNA
jgi:hypothetical protein